MKNIELQCDIDLTMIISESNDYNKAEAGLLKNMAFQLFLIREFEQTLLKLSADGCIHGPVHTSIGEEACAVGAMMALKPTDKISSTHRAHHHYLAKIFNYYLEPDSDVLRDNFSDTIQSEMVTLMGEIMGLSIGCCGGRGGSVHLMNEKIAVIGTNAIVAGGVPLAIGAAFASKYKKSDGVMVCFLGDGAVNQGAFHEAVKAAAYRLAGRVVDGMDPLAVMKATQEAIEYCRSGNGAVILEAKCYRFPHHAGPIDGSNFTVHHFCISNHGDYALKDVLSTYTSVFFTQVFDPSNGFDLGENRRLTP